jgi:hypothetical protein
MHRNGSQKSIMMNSSKDRSTLALNETSVLNPIKMDQNQFIVQRSLYEDKRSETGKENSIQVENQAEEFVIPSLKIDPKKSLLGNDVVASKRKDWLHSYDHSLDQR